MLVKLCSRLTYANVASTLALFVALGGVSYAAVKLPRNSVGTAQLRKNAVTGVKIKNRAVSASKIGANAVTGFHVAESTLAAVPEATHAAAAESAKTAASAGSAPLSRLDYESTVTTIPAGFVTATGATSCPTGLYLTGGGAIVDNDVNAFINDSGPLNRTTWEATGITYGSSPATMTVYAICAPSASVTP
jgi:hypothetical protein